MPGPLTLEERVRRAVKTQDTERLRDLLRARAEIQAIKEKLGPQSKEDLWEWFYDRLGVELSRVAVCPGHCPQLDMVWEVYNFEVLRVLWVMSRGGGKTSLAAWLDDCQAEHWPGWSSFTIGANRTQGDRKYEYLLPLVVDGGVIGGKELDHVQRSIATKTQYKNGSSIEIALGSSPENANGPRTPRLHRDEVELMQDDTYKQAGNIPAGRKMRDGRYARAQILDTSTMKQAGGRVDTLMKEYDKAIENGQRPRMEVRVCCLFEVAAENPSCRSVPEEERKARLIELGLPSTLLCDCDTYVSDTWPREEGVDEGNDVDDDPRTLESVCQGRFFRSRGHKAFDDIQTLFLENDRETWNAEQECSEPSREGTYLKSYSPVRHGISGYMPDPENGLIYQAVDWGADDEHAVIWFQILDKPVRVKAHLGEKIKEMPVGAVVAFSELFEAQIGNVALGEKVIATEANWIMAYPGWMVHERYPDSANLGARLDWRDHLGLVTTTRIRKDFKEEVKYVRSRVGNRGRFYIDINSCPTLDKAIRAWRQKNGHEVHDWASHPLAAFRYFEHNIQVTERKNAKRTKVGSGPIADDSDFRATEREQELAHMQRQHPLRAGGGQIVMIGGVTDPHATEDLGIGGAEDSPLRAGGLRMGSESEWRAGLGDRHDR